MPGDAVPYVRFSCPCGGSLTVRADEAKKVASCPFCGTQMRIVKRKKAGNRSSSRLSHSGSRSKSRTGEPMNTVERSLTETNDSSLKLADAHSRDQNLIPEWSPNKIVKPGSKRRVKRTYTNSAHADTSNRDLYITAGLGAFCVLFIGGLLFWMQIKNNRSGDDSPDGIVVESIDELNSKLAAVKDGPEVAVDAAVDAANEDDQEEVIVVPKLASPCIKFIGSKHSVVQALLSSESAVVGDKLFIDIEIENLSGFELSSISFEVVCYNSRYSKSRFIHKQPFNKPLVPGEIAEITLTNEWDRWQNVEVFAFQFEGEGMSNFVRVGPLLIEDED